MTPGFAQSRDQLPWLYYPESDRVIINAHNFDPPPSGPVGIGGEVAWWCPSLDPAKTGSVLTDLIAGNNATLTNMALSGSASNWVADASSGGNTAIDLDGVNDYGSIGSSIAVLNLASPFSVSAWYRTTAAATYQMIFSNQSVYMGLYNSKVFVQNGATWVSNGGTVTANTWQHVVYLHTGSAMQCYLNGSAAGSVASAAAGGSSTKLNLGMYYNNTIAPFKGRLDDVRVFSRVLSAGEITDLASQRGYQP